MPVKIVMADDEQGVLLLLGSFLSELEDALVVGTAKNAIDAIKLVKEKSPDVAFLDIELPDMIGIELAENLREIKPDLAVVFITAHQEYSLDAFRLYASDYILKPIDQERVKTTFRRIQQMLKIQKNNPSNLNLQTARISINLGNERVFVKLNEIFYIEKAGRHTFIYCSDGKFKTRETLQELEQHLGNGFFRSHKSYIINTDWIERIVNYPNSSYYEVRFKNCQGKALLSRDRIQDLMSYSDLNVLRG
ncbi:LytR/AlgR family response regulator transcription factor [Phosphitispora fastidiosa]|uniref:LytR/AlgR family response regulator transcription factor n=1 Tax=Phosphitispora fastidiosa TaxID=2837202 RepID=UPI001E5304A0|nr:LytTR family DNA-binding domain-containing protein [Phosphitispora fastidiosa]MBU7008857.1 DNA-binding LytR/AlgR family response regulator [Phosphitispora fastidiosa]